MSATHFVRFSFVPRTIKPPLDIKLTFLQRTCTPLQDARLSIDGKSRSVGRIRFVTMVVISTAQSPGRSAGCALSNQIEFLLRCAQPKRVGTLVSFVIKRPLLSQIRFRFVVRLGTFPRRTLAMWRFWRDAHECYRSVNTFVRVHIRHNSQLMSIRKAPHHLKPNSTNWESPVRLMRQAILNFHPHKDLRQPVS